MMDYMTDAITQIFYQALGTALLILAIFCLPFTVVNAMVAYQKGRSVIWAIAVSLLCTPLISYLYLLAVPPLAKAQVQSAVPAAQRASVWKDE